MIPKFEFKGQPLTKEQTDIFIKLSFCTDEKYFEDDQELMQYPIFKIISSKNKSFELNLKISNILIVALEDFFIKGNPGKAMGILWILYCNYNGEMITFKDAFFRIFPYGLPTHQEFEIWWDSQKCNRGKMVDLKNYWSK
jgi:hypothetical protein